MERGSFKWQRMTGMLIALAAILNLVVAITAASAADQPAELSAVLDDLRKGGYVIYFRHASTDQTGPSDEAADLTRCDTQRNLSATGHEQAVQIGQAFRALRIPIGSITTSPFCRCKDTAKLAFGRFIVDNDLFFAIGTSAGETKRMTDSLRRMLSTPPARATNNIIVSHTANLREAAGIWPKPEGVAYIFRPLSEGRFEAIAMALPEDWVKAAQSKPPGKSK